tara:strand:+ start:5685 stop:6866 length:1182 start_codon:yes stop_codon:yes gene_type:complete
MKINHPLMHNNFLSSDMNSVRKLIKNKNLILTQSKKVLEFENKWSKWLGVKYSVFVNSGSSANFLSMLILKSISSKKKEIIVPTLTWVSDINSVIMSGFKPVFVDINPKNLSMDEDQVLKKINKNTFAVFITHVQGFNGLSDKLLKTLKSRKILLIEDVCESHGAKFKGKKLGTFGLISNFSFYYAHHMSTIEGGMICTNNKDIYEKARIFRSHGMAREAKNFKFQKKMEKKYPKLSPQFIFLYPTFNFRNNEIGAVIGLNQLKRLNKNNSLRTRNLKLFLSLLDPSKYRTDYDILGSSNYAFPIIFKNKNFNFREVFEKTLIKYNIEFRRGNAGGGNQLRQPYLKSFLKNINIKNFPEVDHVHFFGYYIGNYPSLNISKIKKICFILNNINE